MARPTFAKLAHQQPVPAPAPAVPVAIEDDQPLLPMNAPKVQRSRAGKRAIAGYFEPEFSKAIRGLGLETDRTVESLLREALNDLLRKHGKHPFGD